MSEMVKMVARAIFNVAPEGGRTLLPFGVHPETERCLKQARAAIAAMREPTPRMMAAADAGTPDGFHWGIKDGDTVGCRVIYHHMIDTALDEDADLIAAGSGGMK